MVHELDDGALSRTGTGLPPCAGEAPVKYQATFGVVERRLPRCEGAELLGLLPLGIDHGGDSRDGLDGSPQIRPDPVIRESRGSNEEHSGGEGTGTLR